MKQIREAYKKTRKLHHAYAVLGEREKAKEEILNFLTKELKFPTKANPDFWQGDFNVLKIADSRALNQTHLNVPIKYERKIFVISANFITKDAQNSLLKIFEEPRADTVFFLSLPENTDLLPTFKSRLIFGKVDTTAPSPSLTKEGKSPKVEEFLDAKIGKRLTMVAKIVKDMKDEKINKADVIIFLKNLEQGIKEKKDLLAVEHLEKAISYAGDESPSIRVILEHLALVL